LAGGENLLSLHKQGISEFTGFICKKYESAKFVARKKFDFRIDNVGGTKYQHICKKLVREVCGKYSIQTDLLFSDSQKQVCLQMADLFSGEIRREMLGKCEVPGLLQKSKNLQE
jgi:hypothetical protein